MIEGKVPRQPAGGYDDQRMRSLPVRRSRRPLCSPHVLFAGMLVLALCSILVLSGCGSSSKATSTSASKTPDVPVLSPKGKRLDHRAYDRKLRQIYAEGLAIVESSSLPGTEEPNKVISSGHQMIAERLAELNPPEEMQSAHSDLVEIAADIAAASLEDGRQPSSPAGLEALQHLVAVRSELEDHGYHALDPKPLQKALSRVLSEQGVPVSPELNPEPVPGG